jgi:hypothetical protein
MFVISRLRESLDLAKTQNWMNMSELGTRIDSQLRNERLTNYQMIEKVCNPMDTQGLKTAMSGSQVDKFQALRSVLT